MVIVIKSECTGQRERGVTIKKEKKTAEESIPYRRSGILVMLPSSVMGVMI